MKGEVLESHEILEIHQIPMDSYRVEGPAWPLRVNFYYLQSFTAPPAAQPASAPPHRVVARLRHLAQICRSLTAHVTTLVAHLVLLLAAALRLLLRRATRLLPFRDAPAWCLARLFAAVLLQGQVKKFLELIVLIARLRG